MGMDENRLVDLILLIILVLGTAGLAGVYFATSDHHYGEQPALSTHSSPPQPKKNPVSSSRLSFKVTASGDSHPLSVVPSQNEPIGTSDRSDEGSMPPSMSHSKTALPETTAESSPDGLPATASNEAVAPSTDESPKACATPTSTSRPAGMAVDETSKANGNFFSAQDIEEGIITGQRGSADDRADYYRLRATGDIMSLKLEPTLDEGERGFIMKIFDGNKRLMKKGLCAIKVAVVPEATYFIKLDLRNAPIEKPQYHLHITFN